MNIKVRKNLPEYDHDAVYADEFRIGLVGQKDNKIYLEKCPKCRLENWAMAVSGGTCAWCGFDIGLEWKLYLKGVMG